MKLKNLPIESLDVCVFYNVYFLATFSLYPMFVLLNYDLTLSRS